MDDILTNREIGFDLGGIMIIDDLLLNKVEEILNIKLFDAQRKYLLGEGDYWYGGRGSGKTVAYCIKLALSEGDPLNIGKPQQFCDNDYGLEDNKNRYSQWFRNMFLDIWHSLKDAGLSVREVKF